MKATIRTSESEDGAIAHVDLSIKFHTGRSDTEKVWNLVADLMVLVLGVEGARAVMDEAQAKFAAGDRPVTVTGSVPETEGQ